MPHFFNPFLSVSISGETLFLVFDVLLQVPDTWNSEIFSVDFSPVNT